MTGLEISLLIIGAIFFIGSFFVTEKLSSSDVEHIQKMSEKEVHVIVEKAMGRAADEIDRRIENTLSNAVMDLENKSDKETNEKIFAINEYSDTVLDSMNKSHDEVMFLYNMLNEKQEKITKLTEELQQSESNLRAIKEDVKNMLEDYESMKGSPISDTAKDIASTMEDTVVPEDVRKAVEENMESLKQVFMHKIEDEQENVSSEEDDNDRIIQMFKEGYSEIEIAKKMGKGLGEIKLVLGLFDEDYNS